MVKDPGNVLDIQHTQTYVQPLNNRCCEGIKPNLNSKYKSDDYLEGLTKARLVVPYEVNSV